MRASFSTLRCLKQAFFSVEKTLIAASRISGTCVWRLLRLFGSGIGSPWVPIESIVSYFITGSWKE
jgi:hypothetical protein